MASRPAARRRSGQGFSLVEVLLAIFILGIGVISVAAIFPAGMTQQRRSMDEIMGPMVADSALEVIRGKVKPQDFGFMYSVPGGGSHPTVEGDFPWRRPAFFLDPQGTTMPLPFGGPAASFAAGTISIFNINIPNGTGGQDNKDSEVPWNGAVYPQLAGAYPDGPFFTISQRERYYPQPTASPAAPPARPQYVWDCMFRRFGGKILVAIFVYRASASGGGGGTDYVVPISPGNAFPPLPISLDLVIDPGTGAGPPFYSAMGSWDSYGLTPGATSEDDTIVAGTDLTATPFNPQSDQQAWQVGGQWLLDQNNNIHRVMSADPAQAVPLGPGLPTAVRVELVRPPPGYIPLNGPTQHDVYFYDTAPPSGLVGGENIVTVIWYIPTRIGPGVGSEFILTPVYATVREL